MLSKTLHIDTRGGPITTDLGIRMRVANHVRPTRVLFNGHELSPVETDGYYHWHDAHTTFWSPPSRDWNKGTRIAGHVRAGVTQYGG